MPARGRRPMLAEVTVRLPKFSEPFEVQSVVISVPVFGVHFGGINIKPGTFSIRSVAGGVSVDVGFLPYLFRRHSHYRPLLYF